MIIATREIEIRSIKEKSYKDKAVIKDDDFEMMILKE